ncbi:MAG: hypothetical protein RMK18_00755 [Armatimonadota bacterium]|nr:hypothetical protein [Armatimonadota bacterium]MCX7777299.1 hypothetical protein [Armatimonadota bacterium]MDW8024384.1 hypothetical protein [Armatimonadota bacterium]
MLRAACAICVPSELKLVKQSLQRSTELSGAVWKPSDVEGRICWQHLFGLVNEPWRLAG